MTAPSLFGLCLSLCVQIPVGVLLLIGLVNTVVPKEFFSRIFTGNKALDPLIGALFCKHCSGESVDQLHHWG